MKVNIIREAVRLVPQVRAHLSNRARYVLYEPVPYKTYDYMLAVIENLVESLYNNQIGGEFIDIMANLISGQFTQAYRQAMEDEGMTDEFMPDYLAASLEAAILGQYDYVDQFFRDVIDARLDGTSITPLLARAQLWANRYTEAYNEAVRLMAINNGQKLMWVEGDTDHKCSTCLALDGIVAWASEWDALDVKPQNGENTKLECRGFRCQCALVPTDKRRSPDAYGKIEEIILATA